MLSETRPTVVFSDLNSKVRPVRPSLSRTNRAIGCVGDYVKHPRQVKSRNRFHCALCNFRVAGYNCHPLRTMPSVYIKTYGCQMNERDSEAVAAQLVAKGYTLAASEAAADVVLLNTCSVRDGAEQKAIGKMTALAGELRRSRPNVVLGFM